MDVLIVRAERSSAPSPSPRAPAGVLDIRERPNASAKSRQIPYQSLRPRASSLPDLTKHFLTHPSSTSKDLLLNRVLHPRPNLKISLLNPSSSRRPKFEKQFFNTCFHPNERPKNY